MREEHIREIVDGQREYFLTGATLPVKQRIRVLRRFKEVFYDYEPALLDALYADLGKSRAEGYMCEIGMVMSEISYMEKHLAGYARDHRVRTPLAQFCSRSFVKPSPYGVVLVMSPWNYPVMLTMEPMIDALAAGNTVIVKPSAYSPRTSLVIAEIVSAAFPPELVCCVTGGRAENQSLLNQKFDYIFFTGSQAVGKVVMEKASEHLTPVTLELGGKSPCIIDDTANLSIAARRIAFGKYLNCGQTCVAPDYILCHRSVKDQFLARFTVEIRRQYGEHPLNNPDYGKIINEKHFGRIFSLIDRDKVVYGGAADARDLRIEPTVMDHITWEDEVMQQEIFGPVMPILVYDDIDEVIDIVNSHQKPLALYYFSSDRERIDKVLSSCQFGGGCVNDTNIHLATSNMGFGGVGESGMGAYHGKAGFDTFTHRKSIVDKKTWLDLGMRYQPYTKNGQKLVRMFMR